MSLLKSDLKRYPHQKDMPIFQKFMRKYQDSNNKILKVLYKILFVFFRYSNKVEIAANSNIGKGLYIGHAYCITINPNAVIGSNCSIHKGVTIGQENRGKRKGSPIIGNEVWMGINSTIVGAITIGDDVLIAPNSYVNCDVPSHSVVFGNPCVIKHKENATESYIENKVL